ncbi:ABC transporter ATP-binding protein [Streptomyces oryzae]|uniref:ABC transporter ATP-binding protein n=1 Tax=Streptomyces oryzae TaxID=1434886 RepID=A0ABS3X8M2_9ACTN|nr:ABC transporter ATP-binding protein [Streptomyces oryzae]MBO8191728.1 ABC transporter ATP-binding protein [Streptomyces oryzae]
MLGRPRTHPPARPRTRLAAARSAPAGRSAYPALELDGVSRSYGSRRALAGVDLVLPPGRFLAVMGRSGSGKSTLLACAAGLDRPDEGSVTVGGTDLAALGERDRTRVRRDRIGFVFQDLNLLPALSARENVALPLLLAEEQSSARALDGEPLAPLRRADRALAQVGLPDRAEAYPGQLSGGQRQRVAVARALVTAPEVILADEPTGALDPVTAQEVLGLLRRASAAGGPAVLMVTHDPAAAAMADRTVFLTDGRITATLERPSPEAVRGELARC